MLDLKRYDIYYDAIDFQEFDYDSIILGVFHVTWPEHDTKSRLQHRQDVS